jgi:pyrroline-5-carboxylate reductase
MMATDINDVRRAVLSDMGIATTSSNLDVAKACDVLFIAVKPNVVRAVLQEVKASLTADTLIVSIAAGVTLSVLQVPHTPPPPSKPLPNHQWHPPHCWKL